MIIEGNQVLQISAAAAAIWSSFFHYRGILRPVSARNQVKPKFQVVAAK
jgi:hypothetical protein